MWSFIRMMFRILVACLLTGVFSTCSNSPTTPQLPPPGGSPKIFSSYDANGKSTLAGGWVRGFDMSGVSFNSTRTCTLITPRHVIMAKHFQRPINSSVVFHDRDGNRCERMLIEAKGCEGDAAVGLLDSPVPDGYAVYPLPWIKSDSKKLINKPIVVTDQQRNIFFHRVNYISGGRLIMKHDPKEQYGWAKNLIVGDSGNPSFLIANDRLVLAETHHTGGPGAGPYYGDLKVQNSVVQAVKELDPKYDIKVQLVGIR